MSPQIETGADGFYGPIRTVMTLARAQGKLRPEVGVEYATDFFFWTLLRRPRLLPQAITLAIYGHHFRRVCEIQGIA